MFRRCSDQTLLGHLTSSLLGRGRLRAAAAHAASVYPAGDNYDDDDGDRAVVYLGEPIHSHDVLIRRDRLANMTNLER